MPLSTSHDTGAERVGIPLDPQLADLHHLRFKLVLFVIWFAASFGVSYFAEYLQFKVGSWPFSYWMGAQGGVLIFIVLAWAYYLGMRHFERGSDTPVESDKAARPHG